MSHTKTKKLVLISLFTAISVVLLMVSFLRFPLIPAAAFLEYDAMDVPILMGGLLLGSGAGFLITALAAVVQGFTVSSSSGLYGIIMHFIATGAFVGVSSLVYRKSHTTKRLILALILGALAMTAIMIPANILITPIFMGVPRSVVVNMMLPVFIPFNLLKSFINAAVTLFVYAPLRKAIEKSSFLD